MKISELSGAALDWAVARAEGEYKPVAVPAYSTDWAHGGPIIEREGMTVALDAFGWEARHYDGESEPWVFIGDTLLIAAMRCYAASKLGDEVEIPEELSC